MIIGVSLPLGDELALEHVDGVGVLRVDHDGDAGVLGLHQGLQDGVVIGVEEQPL